MEELVRALCRGELQKVENQLSIYPFLLDEVDEVRSLSIILLPSCRIIALQSSTLYSTIISHVLNI